MTIRRLWLIVLILAAIISISINALVLSTLTDRYFKDYMTDNYEKHFDQIVEYSKNALTLEHLSIKQMAMELETHLVDPITRIKLYDTHGNLIIDVSTDSHSMMGNDMMGMMNFHYNASDGEVDSIAINIDGISKGQLNITRYSAIEDSIVIRRFKYSLLINSLYSIAIVLILAILAGIFISKRMSRDLIQTAKMAQDISLGEDAAIRKTNIREINTIQQSLETLNNRLKLKSKSRKVLIDEMVHQTRTPLTVLKTHLEGFDDKIIDMNPKEIKIFEDQIENITTIISNISNMIDAEKDFDSLNIQEFELNSLLKQIVNGLKAQFNNKKIALKLISKQKYNLNTDKYKLSQVIYNLLTNAYKFTPEGGNVSVDYKLQGNFIIISIKDSGIGMLKEDISGIFDAYYRIDKLNKASGEGLGLYLVKEKLSKIHGSIAVHSELNVGSEFTIKIPINISDY